MQGEQFVGGTWDWLNPFAAAVALAVLCGYVLLVATWLILKAEGDVQFDSYRYAQVGTRSLLILALAVWSISRHPFLARKWFTAPDFWLTCFPLLLATAAFICLIGSLLKLQETAPFVRSLALVALATLAAGASIHPYIIPPAVTLKAAAAPSLTLRACSFSWLFASRLY
jgi:cytochrome d ubiquinol oxidase subunit II